MDVSPGLQLVSRHWRLVGIAALVASVLAFGLSYLWSPRYTSATHVLIRAQDTRYLNQNGQDLAQQAIISQGLANSLGDTNSSLVTSRTVAVAVVDDLKLDQRTPDMSPLAQARRAVKTVKDAAWNILIHGYYAQPSTREGAITEVQNNLSATPVKNGFVIEIRASADNPKDAAALANSASKELIALARDRDQTEANRYRDFLKQQLDDEAKQVAAAEEAVSKYKRDHGLTDINEQLRLDAQSSSAVRSELRDTDVQLAAAQAQYSALVAQLNNTPVQNQSTNTIATGRSTTTTTTSSASDVYSNLKVAAAGLNAQVASLQAKHDSLTSLLTAQTTGLPEQEAQLSNLELKLSNANSTYSGIAQAYEAASTNSALGATEMTPIDRAGEPLYPDRPLRYLFLLVGLLLGAVGGTGLGWWTERRRRGLNAFAATPIANGHPLPAPVARAQ